MPTAQLLSSIIESALNQLLSMDEASNARLLKLEGKKVIVDVMEFPQALALHFSDQVFVGMLSRDDETSFVKDSDLYLKADLNTLLELQDSSQITRLIKADKVQINGDINLAQHVASLFKDLNIDWEQQIANHVGDVAAYHISSLFKKFKSDFSEFGQSVSNIVKDAALEEKKIAAHPLLVEEFVTQVHELSAQTDMLEQKINQLSSQRKQ